MKTNHPLGKYELLQLQEDDLYAAIGEELTGSLAVTLTQSELIERGQEWFITNRACIRSAVCPYAKVLIEENETLSALIALADLLSHEIFIVAPEKVAALILKVGAKTLCDL